MSPYNTKWPGPPGQLVQGHAEDCVYRHFPMGLDHSRSIVHNNEPHLQCLLCRAIMTLPIAEDEPEQFVLSSGGQPHLEPPAASPRNDLDLIIEDICNAWAAEQRFAFETIDVLERSIWLVLTDKVNEKSAIIWDGSPFQTPQMDRIAK